MNTVLHGSNLSESMEFAEWIGEFRLLMRLQEKAETLRDIRIELGVPARILKKNP